MQQHRIFLIILVFCVLVGILPAQAQAAVPDNFQNSVYHAPSKAALVMDVKSGQVLYSQNANQVLPVASMSKMFSLFVVLKAIHSGQLNWTDTITPNAAQAALSRDSSLSNVPLTVGTAYTVKELYDASWIYSANVAVMLLAQKVAGSQSAFVQLMNQQLIQWGIEDAEIVNVSGLSNSLLGDLQIPGADPNAENKMSAVEIATVATKLLTLYPEILKVTRVPKQVFHVDHATSFNMTNWNALLPGLKLYDPTLPVDGLKTGTSDTAGDCFTATLPVQNRRLVAVVMNAQGAKTDKTKRFVVTKNIFHFVLNQWQFQNVLKKRDALKHYQVKVIQGQKSHVPVALAKSLSAWQQTDKVKVGGQLILKSTYKKGIKAPVRKHQIIGAYELNNTDFAFDYPIKLPVYTAIHIAKLTWYQIFWQHITNTQ